MSFGVVLCSDGNNLNLGWKKGIEYSGVQNQDSMYSVDEINWYTGSKAIGLGLDAASLGLKVPPMCAPWKERKEAKQKPKASQEGSGCQGVRVSGSAERKKWTDSGRCGTGKGVCAGSVGTPLLGASQRGRLWGRCCANGKGAIECEG